ncbi:MAG: hypothetical protein AAGA56_28590 [Myxococcota bacterium]
MKDLRDQARRSWGRLEKQNGKLAASLRLAARQAQDCGAVARREGRALADVARDQFDPKRLRDEMLLGPRRAVLARAQSVLAYLQRRVEGELRALEAPPRERAVEAALIDPREEVPSGVSVTAPLHDYESMNAKTVIAAVQQAEPSLCHAIVEWERAHKNRTTVIRAAEGRLQEAA